MGIVEQYLAQLNIEKRRLHRAAAILTVLSLLVAVGVSWNLRMTGITMANSAGCGWEEHQHVEECLTEGILICGYDCEEQHEEETAPPDGEETDAVIPEEEPAEEHVHTDECWQREYICGYDEHIHDITCYSDPKADVENQLDWQEMFEDYPYTGELYKDLVGIAKTQVGYTESALNYETDDEGMKRGYTRYGAWYGSPYSDWSAMFVSFCLEYAGTDTDEYPVSPGADTMAGLWDKQGKYIAAGEYTPQIGDIVFFDDNTAGIVAEVQNATIYVIGGDVDDAVSGQIIPINDNSIEGWGVIERTQPEVTDEIIPEDMQDEVTEEITDETVIEEEQDISDGPIVTIYAGGIKETQEEYGRIQTYSLKNTRETEAKNLVEYLLNDVKGGGHFITLFDGDGNEMPKDDDGNYIVQAGAPYKLNLTFKSLAGIAPGTYTYQLPSGLLISSANGEFVLDKTNTEGAKDVGTWKISDTGLIEIELNKNMDIYTEVVITAKLDATFETTQDSIKFDGEIIVTVEPPPEQQYPTKVEKWANPGDGSGKYPETSKLYWTIKITGNKDSNIPGNILTDKLLLADWSKEHSYTESDIAEGIEIIVPRPHPETGEIIWHRWHVSDGDPNLTWTEKSWSYKMPLTVECECGCRDTLELGNEGWEYSVNYTSTPNTSVTAGTYIYINEASIDGARADGWVQFTHGELEGVIEKKGNFVADAESGKFVWEFSATIPGIKQGGKADYFWYIMDYMYLKDQQGNTIAHIDNDANLSKVIVEYQGETIQVPRIQDATANDMFAWDNAWSDNVNGSYYLREFNLLCRCQCTADNCPFAKPNEEYKKDAGYWYMKDDGSDGWNTDFCQCWTIDEDVTFTFVYETDDVSILQEYGGRGYQLLNEAKLFYRPDPADQNGAQVSDSNANVLIPGVFKKELTKKYDGYTAHYQITVNEAKLDLTNGTPLTIHDVMTDTLAYIGGSLVIRAEDRDGNVTTLKQGEDFTVTYDGSGNQEMDGNPAHVLDIVILNPQPVMYTLDYDTILVLPDIEDLTGSITYKNYAVITLWGENISSGEIVSSHGDINITAETYSINLYKTCGQTNLPLPGATFGLYNAQDGLIAERTTDENGHILFQTKHSEGIVMMSHNLYYIQEIAAPTGYLLDDTKNWFVFCNSSSNTCDECNRVIGNTDAKRIPFEQIGRVDAVNVLAGFELPATGGRGITLNILCGLILISAPLVYGLSMRRKHERRFRE